MSCPTGAMRARFARQGGFNLLEILLALAIFSVGILEVLAVFPAAVVNGARATREAQARLLQRTAMAELQYQLRVSFAEGTVGAYAAPTLTAQGAPGWTPGQWTGFCVTITNRLSTSGQLQCARITGNTANTLTLAGAAGLQVLTGDRFRITELALPAATEAETARVYRVTRVHDTERHTLLAETAAGASPAWPDDRWNAATARYFIVFNTGEAKDRVYRIADTRLGNELVCNAYAANPADFIADGVRTGDEFIIIGCDRSAVRVPNETFGVSGSRQTTPPPHLRVPVWDAARSAWVEPEQTYSYVVVVSDAGYDPDPAQAGDEDLTLNRVDVFVYHRYDDALPPERNKRPIGHFVEYLGRR